MSLRWHGIVGSLGIIGLVAAPGLIVDRWVAGGPKQAGGEVAAPLEAPSTDISLDQHGSRAGVVFLTANRFDLWELGGWELGAGSWELAPS